jgi:hypothetical protein
MAALIPFGLRGEGGRVVARRAYLLSLAGLAISRMSRRTLTSRTPSSCGLVTAARQRGAALFGGHLGEGDRPPGERRPVVLAASRLLQDQPSAASGRSDHSDLHVLTF